MRFLLLLLLLFSTVGRGDNELFYTGVKGKLFRLDAAGSWVQIGADPLARATFSDGKVVQRDYPWGSVRVGPDGKVEVARDGEWQESGIRPPPQGMSYVEGHVDANGNLAVALGGSAKGFNFKFSHGPVILASKQEWEGGTPKFEISQMAGNPYGAGFLVVTKDNALWVIEPPTRSRRTFIAHSLSPSGSVEALIPAGRGVVIKRADGSLHRVVSGSDGAVEIRAVPPPEGGEKLSPGELLSTAVATDAVRAKKFLEENGASLAAPPLSRTPGGREFRDLLSYEEFEALLQDSVRRLPEVQSIWGDSDLPARRIYLVGGTLRAVVQWLHDQLKTHSPDEIRAMTVPSLKKLLPSKDADRDLSAPDDVARAIEVSSRGEWDVLSETFYKGSVKAGGPTIEKVRVNPWRVDDPLGGLKALYEGRLEYHLASRKEFDESAHHGLNDNSQTTLALRFLRFTQDISFARPSAESFETLRRLQAIEARSLPDWHNYWLNKALWKFYESTGRNAAKTMALLKEAGLLHFLASRGYRLDADRITIHHAFSFNNDDLKVGPEEEWRKYDFTLADLKPIQQMLSAKPRGTNKLYRIFLSRAVEPRDFLFVYERMREDRDAWGEKGEILFRESLPRFFAASPSPAELRSAERLCVNDDTSLIITHERLKRATTLNDLIAVLNSVRERNHSGNSHGVKSLIAEGISRIPTFSATLDELTQAEKETHLPDVAKALKRMAKALLPPAPEPINVPQVSEERSRDLPGTDLSKLSSVKPTFTEKCYALVASLFSAISRR